MGKAVGRFVKADPSLESLGEGATLAEACARQAFCVNQ